MMSEYLNKTILFLSNAQDNYSFGDDVKKVQYLYTELRKIKSELPTEKKIDELQKIVIDLEVKYDNLNELSYYFNPLYVKIKNEIHNEYVKKIREENKRKREMN